MGVAEVGMEYYVEQVLLLAESMLGWVIFYLCDWGGESSLGEAGALVKGRFFFVSCYWVGPPLLLE